MREIKFRVYRLDLRQMYPPFSIWKANLYGYQHKDEIIIMQYTGLKDKNGKEIYEGDIIRTHKDQWSSKCALELPEGTYPVTFDNGCFKIVYDIEEILTDMFGENVCEVIGNIYENPELLKEN